MSSVKRIFFHAKCIYYVFFVYKLHEEIHRYGIWKKIKSVKDKIEDPPKSERSERSVSIPEVLSLELKKLLMQTKVNRLLTSFPETFTETICKTLHQDK